MNYEVGVKFSDEISSRIGKNDFKLQSSKDILVRKATTLQQNMVLE
tara:strand:- start:344 stop:481 length:138 start_codon:yes stop_codon:yes gene_type:complete